MRALREGKFGGVASGGMWKRESQDQDWCQVVGRLVAGSPCGHLTFKSSTNPTAGSPAPVVVLEPLDVSLVKGAQTDLEHAHGAGRSGVAAQAVGAAQG